jgi:tetratricopeptide (TPR) repeat protein
MPEPAQNAVALRRRQRSLLVITGVVVVLAGAGIWAYVYASNAPQRAEKEFQAGMNLMTPGRYSDAISHFTKALAMNGQLPNAYLERGNAHRFMGEQDEALADYQAAVARNPSLAAAHAGIALIYIQRHDIPHALESLNKSIALKPVMETYYQRGQIMENQGDHRKAIEDYTRAIAEQVPSPYLYRARALAKHRLGDRKGAKADRAAAVKIEHQ